MVFRRRYRHVKHVSDDVLRQFIVEHLSRCPAKEQSISYLVSCIRDDEKYVPTRLNDAESVFTSLGFKLRRECNEYGAILRTYVQLGANHGEESKETGRVVGIKTVSFEEVTCKFPKSCEWPECYCSADEGS
jgi:hypothetical protein